MPWDHLLMPLDSSISIALIQAEVMLLDVLLVSFKHFLPLFHFSYTQGTPGEPFFARK